MPPTVRLYSLSTCGSCRAMKQLLSKTGIPFEIIAMELLDEAKCPSIMPEFKKADLQGSFPSIVINGRVIFGNDSKAILEALYL